MRSLNVAFVLASAATSVIVEIYIYIFAFGFCTLRALPVCTTFTVFDLLHTSQICLCYNPASNPTPVTPYTIFPTFLGVIRLIYYYKL